MSSFFLKLSQLNPKMVFFILSTLVLGLGSSNAIGQDSDPIIVSRILDGVAGSVTCKIVTSSPTESYTYTFNSGVYFSHIFPVTTNPVTEFQVTFNPGFLSGIPSSYYVFSKTTADQAGPAPIGYIMIPDQGSTSTALFVSKIGDNIYEFHFERPLGDM